jgi:hypothetical protein
MPHTFENFAYSYWKNGKPIFAPSERGRELGEKLKKKIERRFTFDSFVYHFRDGSHVTALHRHRKSAFFCRVDIERFFYSIRRNRLKRVLKEIGIARPEYYAKWSTVRNPYDGGGYVLPYGFIQSPILATLVLSLSPVGQFIRDLGENITASVYMDDICLSSQDEAALEHAFSGLLAAIEEAGFNLNEGKTRPVAQQIDIFSCSLENENTEVLPDRVEKFHEIDRSPAGEAAFAAYCDIVKSHTWRVGQGKRRRRRLAAAKRRRLLSAQNAPSSNPTGPQDARPKEGSNQNS